MKGALGASSGDHMPRHHDLENTVNGIILWEGWRTWRELTEPELFVEVASMLLAGSFCFSKSSVQINQNKLNETSFQLIALKKTQELTTASHPKLKCSKEHCISHCVHCQSEKQTVPHTQNTQCTFTQS